MTLTERIAKRKAEGWRHIGFHVRDKRTGELYAPCGRKTFETEQAFLYAPTFDTSKAKPWQRFVPVFKRTIRTKRGHGFGWALARMKEGKRVRASRWDKRCSLRLSDEFFYTFVGYDGTSRKYELLSYDVSDTWELTE